MRYTRACRSISPRSPTRQPGFGKRSRATGPNRWTSKLRDGLIQRFEFTYELSYKTLRHYLQEWSPSSEEVARMSFAELIRAGTAQGLLRAERPVWRHFRDIRTRTIHTYDAD